MWVPAVLMAQKLSRGAEPTDIWKAVLRGCPSWMRRLFYVLFAYAFINFFAGITLGSNSEANDFRIFSGHWILFYFAALAMLHSADRLGSLGPRSCPNGHEISPFAKYCEKCGSQLPPPPIV